MTLNALLSFRSYKCGLLSVNHLHLTHLDLMHGRMQVQFSGCHVMQMRPLLVHCAAQDICCAVQSHLEMHASCGNVTKGRCQHATFPILILQVFAAAVQVGPGRTAALKSTAIR